MLYVSSHTYQVPHANQYGGRSNVQSEATPPTVFWARCHFDDRTTTELLVHLSCAHNQRVPFRAKLCRCCWCTCPIRWPPAARVPERNVCERLIYWASFMVLVNWCTQFIWGKCTPNLLLPYLMPRNDSPFERTLLQRLATNSPKATCVNYLRKLRCRQSFVSQSLVDNTAAAQCFVFRSDPICLGSPYVCMHSSLVSFIIIMLPLCDKVIQL